MTANELTKQAGEKICKAIQFFLGCFSHNCRICLGGTEREEEGKRIVMLNSKDVQEGSSFVSAKFTPDQARIPRTNHTSLISSYESVSSTA